MGRGIASRALTAFLEIETRRPSMRVLEKAGFKPSGAVPDGFAYRLD